MKTIVFTGGGSAGHVTPNLAIIPALKDDGWNVLYIGSITGIEKQLIAQTDVSYHAISSGKLRRYLDWQNVKDPFHIIKGLAQAYLLLRKIKPHVVFSKGGFVSVPVVIASWLNRIPVVIHESDMTPGLANRLCVPFTRKICVTFAEAAAHLPQNKVEHTGTPIRKEIFEGTKEKGLTFCGFNHLKPVLLIMGGSLGAESINRSIRKELTDLLTRFQVVHLCGKGRVDQHYNHLKGYKQFEYLNAELPDVLAMTDLVVSRAGSNSICELLALHKPNLLIPLSLQQSRGDQLLNAKSFEKQGFSKVIYEEELMSTNLYQVLSELYADRHHYIEKMRTSRAQNSVNKIVELIYKVAAN
ncbi:MAG: undecaprenyldiphospho-muramoylpentapeptide beta-N-acetylglucosaminyltransferase [Bacilli bacterium]|nr:undecaprenyldiphospho-muramoylpentapeptide beta-N-acetylglucosaminyltransferase [Bacilli bacterium]